MLASLGNISLHHASSCSVARLSMCGSVRLEGDCPILNALLGSHTNVYKGTLGFTGTTYIWGLGLNNQNKVKTSILCVLWASSCCFLIVVAHLYLLIAFLPSYAHIWYRSIDIAITCGWNHLWKYHFTHAMLSSVKCSHGYRNPFEAAL